MNEIDSVFDTSSKEILNLARNLSKVHLHDKLLDRLMIDGSRPKKERKRKNNTRFKIHPEIISSSDSDTSKQPFKQNGFKNHRLLLYNHNEEKIGNGNPPLNENNFCLLSRKHSPILSCCSDSLNSIPQMLAVAAKPEKHCLPTSTPPSGATCVKRKVVTSKNDENKKQLVNKKLLIFLQKIMSCVEDIRISLDMNITMPDGDDDWHKRQVRASEFCSRLQRNYLYQLGRQITELQKYTKNPDISNPHRNFAHCITGAHQTLLQVFQAYHNHIPTSLGDVVVDKLKIVITHTNSLFDVHGKFLNLDESDGCRRKDLIETIRGRCNVILEKAFKIMEQHEGSKKKKFASHQAPVMKNSRKRNSTDNRLSMYSLSTFKKSGAVYRRAIEAFGNNKSKCGYVESRYRTAGFKHRPPFEKPKVSTPKLKLLGKKSLPRIKETPFTTPKNDDEIETMVNAANGKEGNNEHHNCDNKKSCGGCNKNRCMEENEKTGGVESVQQLLQNLCEMIRAKEGEEVSQKQLEILLKGLLEIVLNGKINNNNNGETGSHKNGINHAESLIKTMKIHSLPNLLQKVDFQNGKINMENGRTVHNLQKTIAESVMRFNSELQENGKTEAKLIESTQSIRSNWKTVAVTGEKNAQLICIRDDSSIIESPVRPHPSLATIETDDIQVTDNKEKTIATEQSNEKIVHKENKNFVRNKSKNSIKISRLPKQTLKKLVPLPKPKLKAILHGKLQHAKMIKDNPMYCKTSKTQPWIIVEQISEHLLDHALLLIAEEIQVNNILESLYNSEFQ